MNGRPFFMRFIKSIMALALLAALVSLPLGGAVAEAAIASQQAVEGLVGLHPVNGAYVLRLSGADNQFAVFGPGGEQRSAAYSQIDIRQDMPYFMVTGDPSGMNSRGLVDGSGREVLPPVYGRIDVASDRWILGCVVENWSEIVSTDVYFDGEKIGTLSAEDFTMSSYYTAHGAYLGIGGGRELFYLNSRFERVPSMLDYLSEEYFYDWNTHDIYHLGSGQKAFDPACALTADEVERAVWYQDGSFIGLQGQTLASGQSYNSVDYQGGDYLLLRSGEGAGVADMQGNELLPALYSQLGGDTRSYFAMGYQAALKDGRLSWFDLTGNETAAVAYSLNEGDLQGFRENGLFIFTRALGETVVFTAKAGELPQRYEDAVPVSSPRQRLLCVKLGGLWGAIDTDGHTVIPFEHEQQLQISYDGTAAVDPGRQVVYAISYSGEPAVTAAQPTATESPAAAKAPASPATVDDSWICPDCGQRNDLNFCPNDGTARPEEPAACQSCGYVMPDGSTPNFCPNCGAAFQ